MNGSNLTNYLYDGMDVVLERDSSNNPVTTYLRNPLAQGGIGGILNSQHGSNPEEYYSYDGLGSVAGLTDTTGAAVNAFSYDAFGNLLTDPAQSTTHQFLTKEADTTGFVYFGARYYDPSIGRFITQDPSGMADGPNMYLYCLNDPIDFIDMWGLCKEKNGLDWYFYESALPGPWGQPLSEWNSNGSNWGDLLKYTESASNGWKWGERISIGTASVTASVAFVGGIAEMAGLIDTAPQASNIIRVISKPGKWGIRWDKPHHGKGIHWESWRW